MTSAEDQAAEQELLDAHANSPDIFYLFCAVLALLSPTLIIAALATRSSASAHIAGAPPAPADLIGYNQGASLRNEAGHKQRIQKWNEYGYDAFKEAFPPTGDWTVNVSSTAVVDKQPFYFPVTLEPQTDVTPLNNTPTGASSYSNALYYTGEMPLFQNGWPTFDEYVTLTLPDGTPFSFEVYSCLSERVAMACDAVPPAPAVVNGLQTLTIQYDVPAVAPIATPKISYLSAATPAATTAAATATTATTATAAYPAVTRTAVAGTAAPALAATAAAPAVRSATTLTGATTYRTAAATATAATTGAATGYAGYGTATPGPAAVRTAYGITYRGGTTTGGAASGILRRALRRGRRALSALAAGGAEEGAEAGAGLLDGGGSEPARPAAGGRRLQRSSSKATAAAAAAAEAPPTGTASDVVQQGGFMSAQTVAEAKASASALSPPPPYPPGQCNGYFRKITFMTAATFLAIPPKVGTNDPWTVQLSPCDQETVTLSLEVSAQDYAADLNLEPWPGAPPPWCMKWGYQDLFPGQARVAGGGAGGACLRWRRAAAESPAYPNFTAVTLRSAGDPYALAGQLSQCSFQIHSQAEADEENAAAAAGGKFSMPLLGAGIGCGAAAGAMWLWIGQRKKSEARNLSRSMFEGTPLTQQAAAAAPRAKGIRGMQGRAGGKGDPGAGQEQKYYGATLKRPASRGGN